MRFQIGLTDILLQPPRATKLCCDEVTLPVPQCLAKENTAERERLERKRRRSIELIDRQVLEGRWKHRLVDQSNTELAV